MENQLTNELQEFTKSVEYWENLETVEETFLQLFNYINSIDIDEENYLLSIINDDELLNKYSDSLLNNNIKVLAQQKGATMNFALNNLNIQNQVFKDFLLSKNEEANYVKLSNRAFYESMSSDDYICLSNYLSARNANGARYFVQAMLSYGSFRNLFNAVNIYIRSEMEALQEFRKCSGALYSAINITDIKESMEPEEKIKGLSDTEMSAEINKPNEDNDTSASIGDTNPKTPNEGIELILP